MLIDLKLRLFVAIAFSASSCALAGQPSPEMLSFACGGCHGDDGASVGLSVPSFAGQQKDAFIQSMKEFKSGERPSTVMGRLAKGYTDAEFEAMAGFFAKQKTFKTEQSVDNAKAAKGAQVAEQHCGKCHTDQGKTFKDEGTPIMAGQWLKYLQIQFEDYQSGKRQMTKNMANRMKLISAEEMDDLAHFYASVK